jgi:ATP-dependent protease ClpP protease subunit
MGRPRIWNGSAPVPRETTDPGYKIQNLGGNAADLWIYAEIGGWGVTSQDMVSELSALNVAEITLHLNSPGGDVFDGIAIMNALRDHPANVTVKVDALAASIASVIAQAGNKIIMGRNSMMMIHNASGWAQGEAADLRKMAELLDDTTKNIASVYKERAGGTVDGWLEVMAEETWYSAEDAVKAGLADEVAPMATERDAQAVAARFDLSNFQHAPKITEPGRPDNWPIGEAWPDAPDPTGPLVDFEPIAWDPELVRTAVASAIPQPVTWDPNLFTTAIALVTNDAPASPTTPATAPAATGFDPDIFALAMREARRT